MRAALLSANWKSVGPAALQIGVTNRVAEINSAAEWLMENYGVKIAVYDRLDAAVGSVLSKSFDNLKAHVRTPPTIHSCAEMYVDDVPRFGRALAYCAVFTKDLAPLLANRHSVYDGTIFLGPIDILNLVLEKLDKECLVLYSFQDKAVIRIV